MSVRRNRCKYANHLYASVDVPGPDKMPSRSCFFACHAPVRYQFYRAQPGPRCFADARYRAAPFTSDEKKDAAEMTDHCGQVDKNAHRCSFFSGSDGNFSVGGDGFAIFSFGGVTVVVAAGGVFNSLQTPSFSCVPGGHPHFPFTATWVRGH
jgi:hypothetical protein